MRCVELVRLLTLALALWIFGVASTEARWPRKPVLRSDIVDVEIGDLKSYWVPARQEVSIPDPNAEQTQAIQSGLACRVVAEIVIDSKGRIVDYTILESEPAGLFTPLAEILLRKNRFRPADGNKERTPIRTVMVVTFVPREGLEEGRRADSQAEGR